MKNNKSKERMEEKREREKEREGECERDEGTDVSLFVLICGWNVNHFRWN